MQKRFGQQSFVGAIEGFLTLACVLLVAIAAVGLFDAGVAVA